MPERFLSVHGIGKGKLDYVLKSLKKRGEAPGGEREKHTNRKYKLLEEIRMKIHEHVDSLEGRESHNSWHDSKRKCVLAEPDIKNLYDMFKERYPEVVVSYETYTTTFISHFNIAFGCPRTDTCSKFDEFAAKKTLL